MCVDVDFRPRHSTCSLTDCGLCRSHCSVPLILIVFLTLPVFILCVCLHFFVVFRLSPTLCTLFACLDFCIRVFFFKYKDSLHLPPESCSRVPSQRTVTERGSYRRDESQRRKNKRKKNNFSSVDRNVKLVQLICRKTGF